MMLRRGLNMPKMRLNAYFMAIMATLLTIAIIAMPEEAFNASLEGMRVWWEIVFPALLPFFIAAELLMGLGVVHFMGALLEPLMRPLFNVPGVGAFVVAMGLASGYPIGAKLTGRLRKEGLCSRIEAERLLSFTNTADPLFMIGAVAVGMLGMPALGATIAISHYIASILLGFILAFYRRNEDVADASADRESKSKGLFKRALDELYKAREKDGRSFGILFGDCIKDSVNTLLLIGGYIIMFSVITRVLNLAGVTAYIAAPIEFILRPFGNLEGLIQPIISGLFEITIGCEQVAKASAPLLAKISIISFIIGWSGLSVHAQAASMIKGTDIRIFPYILSRIIHGLLASAISLLLLGPGANLMQNIIVPVFFPQAIDASTFGARLLSSSSTLLGLMTAFAATALITGIASRIRIIRVRIDRRG